MSKVIFFEYPFNEKIRVYLRLEYLFKHLFLFSDPKGVSAISHHIAISTLFEILELMERVDIKNYLLQDLEKQKTVLLNLRSNINVDQQILENSICEIKQNLISLANNGKPGQFLRDHEWLNSIRGRFSVSGFTPHVDMPSYYFWQNQSFEYRSKNIEKWIDSLIPIYDSLAIIIKFLRASNYNKKFLAKNGSYRKMLGGQVYQLLRIMVNDNNKVFPEISANKHIISIRFFNHDHELKPSHVSQDVEFYMSLCNI
ncbi:Cell division protein ZapD [Candidatus Kinetoplastibacterium sorsogonicusi]|uniref:Cell division protein ZapD n=1 Tax=Candidatus Kinetoplastidibacterium kentomonadis TaxID=1576550 RepID=A0A3S7J958_9PROT|nr:cell division protein ZapD [Candidatus Kinetoplastibacterium sorsogonicusi]AWD32210.1 Cell division protein ZapD [Candidatus Kinetoplastibacterium sorsogonicusi]